MASGLGLNLYDAKFDQIEWFYKFENIRRVICSLQESWTEYATKLVAMHFCFFFFLANLVEPRKLVLSHGVRHKPLSRVEGLLRFASKLACRYLRQLPRDFFYFFQGLFFGPFAPDVCTTTILIRFERNLYGNLRRPWCTKLLFAFFDRSTRGGLGGPGDQVRLYTH